MSRRRVIPVFGENDFRLVQARMIVASIPGFRVATAESVEELQRILTDPNVGVVLLDRPSDHLVCRLKRHCPSVPVVAFGLNLHVTSTADRVLPNGSTFGTTLREAVKNLSARKRGPKKAAIASDELRQRCA